MIIQHTHTKEMLCEGDRCISHVTQDKVQHRIVASGLYTETLRDFAARVSFDFHYLY